MDLLFPQVRLDLTWALLQLDPLTHRSAPTQVSIITFFQYVLHNGYILIFCYCTGSYAVPGPSYAVPRPSYAGVGPWYAGTGPSTSTACPPPFMGTAPAEDYSCTFDDLLGASTTADVLGVSQMGGAPLYPTQGT